MTHHLHTPTPSLRRFRLLMIRWYLAAPGLIALGALMSSYAVRGVTATSVRTQPVLAAFDSIGPVWPVVFGAAFVFLVYACLTKRALAYAHLVAGVAMWLYTVALVFGSAFTGASWGTAGLALAVSAASLLLARVYGRSD